ncbi:MAG TPA: oxidative damage protection protein [bacterium]|nr:oxidative damage protection protein [bacterium]
MARTVTCVVLKKEAEGMDYPPVPGELGQKIYDSVSKEAWEQWTALQTMLINEYRLNLADERAQKLLMEKMEEFFYGQGLEPPPDYKPPEAEG